MKFCSALLHFDLTTLLFVSWPTRKYVTGYTSNGKYFYASAFNCFAKNWHMFWVEFEKVNNYFAVLRTSSYIYPPSNLFCGSPSARWYTQHCIIYINSSPLNDIMISNTPRRTHRKLWRLIVSVTIFMFWEGKFKKPILT